MRKTFNQPLALALLAIGFLAATDSVRAELEPSGLIFDIADNVPDEDVQILKSGIEIVRIYIQEFLGGDIPAEIRSTTTVKVVATGLGNQEPGGGGACCTVFSEENPFGARLFFDVLHPQWTGGFGTVIENIQHKAAHEYAHWWQSSIGCISHHDERMGFWLNEGIAEYVAMQTLIHQGAFRPREVANFQFEAALSSGQLDVPLEDFGEPTHEIHPGHVGYLAVDQLASGAPEGPLSVRRICEEFVTQPVTSTDVPKSIPDPGEVSSVLNFPETGAIVDMTLFFQFTHECGNDLVMDLIAPDGRVVRVKTQDFGECSGVPQRLPSINPQLGQPGLFGGREAGGTWTLVTTDTSPGFTGTLDTWSLFPGQPSTWLSNAFESAFGIGLEEFYNEFEPKLLTPKAMPWLMLLLND